MLSNYARLRERSFRLLYVNFTPIFGADGDKFCSCFHTTLAVQSTELIGLTVYIICHKIIHVPTKSLYYLNSPLKSYILFYYLSLDLR